jgi:hypothetical protein
VLAVLDGISHRFLHRSCNLIQGGVHGSDGVKRIWFGV